MCSIQRIFRGAHVLRVVHMARHGDKIDYLNFINRGNTKDVSYLN